MVNSQSKTTIDDVARQAGVSTKTVSRVLNNEENVRSATRQRVMQVVNDLKFRPNLSARRLAGARSYSLALIFDNPSIGYIGLLQKGAIAACHELGYHLMVDSIQADPLDHDAVEGLFQGLAVDGFILTPPLCDNDKILKILRNGSYAFVKISPLEENEGELSIRMDEFEAARQMTDHLVSLGHRKIAFITGNRNHSAARLRCAGFHAAMEDHRLDVPEHYIVQGDFSTESGLSASRSLLAADDIPTAIFASNDDMAAGAMVAAREAGLDVPAQLSIAGFDDSPIALSLSPNLTTIQQPIEQMGTTAVSCLVETIQRRENLQKRKNKEGAQFQENSGELMVVENRTLRFKLIRRGSTAPV